MQERVVSSAAGRMRVVRRRMGVVRRGGVVRHASYTMRFFFQCQYLAIQIPMRDNERKRQREIHTAIRAIRGKEKIK